MKKILYFSAKWCSPCKVLAPLMENLSETYPIQKIDIDDNKELQKQYNVQGVPTVLVLNNNIEQQRLVGLKTKNEYVNAFEK